LKNFDNSVLRTVSLKELAGLGKNKASANKVLSSQMANNYEELLNFPVLIEAGEDNCTGMVHSARFLRGFLGDSQILWDQARISLGIDGFEPVSNYALVSLGIGDLMTPKVWAEIHKPNSRDLSIRMLSRKSVDETWRFPNKPEAPKEFESIQELRMAVATLECAFHKVMPWNMAFKTLSLFLLANDFGAAELVGKRSRTSLVANFIDEILRSNACNWEERRKYFSHGDLCVHWASFLTRNQLQLKTGESSAGTKKKENPGTESSAKKARLPSWVCRNFNAGTCVFKDDKHPSFWDTNFILKHVCSKMNQKGRFCYENHSELNHK